MAGVIDAERLDAQGQPHPADAEDLTVGVMRFRSGAIGHWLLNLAGRGEASFARTVLGTGGSLSVPADRSGKRLRVVQRVRGQDVAAPAEEVLALTPEFSLDAATAALFGGERLADYERPWAEVDANLLGIEQADFVAAIEGGRAPEVTGEQGLRSLAVMTALMGSESLGRMVPVEEALTW
jgi:predicted dehydrogenase